MIQYNFSFKLTCCIWTSFCAWLKTRFHNSILCFKSTINVLKNDPVYAYEMLLNVYQNISVNIVLNNVILIIAQLIENNPDSAALGMTFKACSTKLICLILFRTLFYDLKIV